MDRDGLIKEIETLKVHLSECAKPRNGAVHQISCQLAFLCGELQSARLTPPQNYEKLNSQQQYKIICLANYLNSRAVLSSNLRNPAKQFLEGLKFSFLGLENYVRFVESSDSGGHRKAKRNPTAETNPGPQPASGF